MTTALLVEQLLNGFQLGILLFLLAAGLTLVFGIMDFVNLAHGSFYMLGAFITAAIGLASGSFIIGAFLTIPSMMVIGILLEIVVLRTLYTRDHLDQVLATFGVVIFVNELVVLIWPTVGLSVPLPAFLDESVILPLGIEYPVFRLLVIVVGLLAALGLYLLVSKTRLGMLIRAGASNRTMVGALGVNIKILFSFVFGLGAMLAGLGGTMMAPIVGAATGMGEERLILAFVVIVIGGIGSIKGAFVAAVLIGLIDTMGRSFLDVIFLALFNPNTAETAGPAVSAMLTYILMALVLFFRPQGLFPPKVR